MRYILDVRYNGTDYSGWQTQPNAPTVQGELTKALNILLRKEIETYGAGRTDAGVHAMQMPTHFDYEGELHPHFFRSLNGILPPSIAVMQVYRALRDNFHARFDAISRTYRYNIIFYKDPNHYQCAWWCKDDLRIGAMQEGAEVFKEFDSFESFCKTNASNKTFFCDIMESRWEKENDLWVYHVKANRFLRGMVRTMVGTMYEMGKGKLDAEGLRNILRKKDRKEAGMAAPSHGLFLTEVEYPPGNFEKIEF